MTGVYIVTDGRICPGRTHVDIAIAAVTAGAGCVQLREKDQDDREVYETALEIRRLTSVTGTMFIVNNRADIARACSADGLHVGQNDLPARVARELIGPDAILGVSVANVEEAIQAEADGADYVAPGPIFSTATKSDVGPLTGLASVAAIKAAVNVPVVAIGGIGLSNIVDVGMAGADAAAVISAVVCAADMVEAIVALRAEFDRGKSARGFADGLERMK